MIVALFPQSLVMELESRVAEDGHVSPMMESMAEGLRARSPHENLATSTTLLCDRSDASQASEGREVSQANRVVSVAE